MLSLTVASLLVASQLIAPDLPRGFAPDVATGNPVGGSIIFQLFVSPEGSVEACDVVYTNWTSAQAARACERLVGKKVSQVARTSDGTAVHGTLIFSMVSRTGDRPGGFPFERAADLAISVESLPQDVGKTLSIGALVLVSSEGTIIDCTSSDSRQNFAAVACEQLKQIRVPVRTDAGGAPVAYVTDLRVDFVEDPAPSG